MARPEKCAFEVRSIVVTMQWRWKSTLAGKDEPMLVSEEAQAVVL